MPRFGSARMPAISTTIRRSVSRRTISSSAPWVTFGSTPRNMSLAPSSTITAAVSSGTDQSRRARPPEAVSPDTPALVTSTTYPFARSARSSLTGNAALAGRLWPTLSESPSATSLIGVSAAWVMPVRNKPRNALRAAAKIADWTTDAGTPYERDRIDRIPASKRRKPLMNDTSALQRATPAIALAGVNLSLGRGAARVHILKDIDLNIGRGEAVGMVGPSGSGKSTLLMVMAGLERPDSGSVVVADQALGGLDEDALARFRGRNVGIVFQSFHLIPTMTALENVAVPLELIGAPDAQERATRELAAVGLSERRHHYPAQLSGGEQQRVALARALVPNPAILIADEPTGNLDETTGAEIIELLFAGHEQRGTTLVLVTHDSGLAARCDRVVRLRSGRIEPAAARTVVPA